MEPDLGIFILRCHFPDFGGAAMGAAWTIWPPFLDQPPIGGAIGRRNSLKEFWQGLPCPANDFSVGWVPV